MEDRRNDFQQCIDHLSTLVAKLALDGTVLLVNSAAIGLLEVRAEDDRPESNGRHRCGTTRDGTHRNSRKRSKQRYPAEFRI